MTCAVLMMFTACKEAHLGTKNNPELDDESQFPDEHELSFDAWSEEPSEDAESVDESEFGEQDEDASPELSGENLGPAQRVRVAFFGDQGPGEDADRVLQLVNAERPDIVVILGDLGYHNDARRWSADLDRNLDPNIAVLAVAGNHDRDAWPQYQDVLYERILRINGMRCLGELGVNAACNYKGVTFLLSGVGVVGDGHTEFAEQILAATRAPWKICAWHKTRGSLQVGSKIGADVDWRLYQSCQAHGAITATAHEHSYARTYTLTDIGNELASHGRTGEPDQLELAPGRNFVFVSGLGGKSIRPFNAELHVEDDWWASIVAEDYRVQSGEVSDDVVAQYGVLFMDFGIDDDPNAARGYFKTVDGEILDEFSVMNTSG